MKFLALTLLLFTPVFSRAEFEKPDWWVGVGAVVAGGQGNLSPYFGCTFDGCSIVWPDGSLDKKIVFALPNAWYLPGEQLPSFVTHKKITLDESVTGEWYLDLSRLAETSSTQLDTSTPRAESQRIFTSSAISSKIEVKKITLSELDSTLLKKIINVIESPIPEPSGAEPADPKKTKKTASSLWEKADKKNIVVTRLYIPERAGELYLYEYERNYKIDPKISGENTNKSLASGLLLKQRENLQFISINKSSGVTYNGKELTYTRLSAAFKVLEQALLVFEDSGYEFQSYRLFMIKGDGQIIQAQREPTPRVPKVKINQKVEE